MNRRAKEIFTGPAHGRISRHRGSRMPKTFIPRFGPTSLAHEIALLRELAELSPQLALQHGRKDQSPSSAEIEFPQPLRPVLSKR